MTKPLIKATRVNVGIFRGVSPRTQDDYLYLKEECGVTRILDLQNGSRFLGDENILKAQLQAKRLKIDTYNMPLGEVLPPAAGELSSAYWFLVDANRMNITYVHCKDGVDRTGMVIAYYRMHYEKWSKAQAVEEMHNLGMHCWLKWWGWFL